MPMPFVAERNPDFDTRPDQQVTAGRREAFTRVLLIALAAFGVWVASLAFIALIPAAFFIPYVLSQGIDLSDPAAIVEIAKSDPTAILVQMAAILPAHLLTLGAAWLFITRGRKFNFWKTLGWDRGGFQWWHYLLILGGFFLVAYAVQLVIPEQENEMIRMLRSSRTVVYAVAFIATFTAPLVEEVIYRGVLYSAFRRAAGVTASFVVVTGLFALVHLPQYYPSYSTMLLLTLLSVVLTLIRVKTDNLLPCVILHTVFNGFQSVLLVIEPLITKPEPSGPTSALFRLFP
ncbi:MAG: type II CAAX endopeptidase family protein [Pyrinomonadaceae bacterium]